MPKQDFDAEAQRPAAADPPPPQLQGEGGVICSKNVTTLGAFIAGLLVFGSADTVSRKIALASMNQYPFFLSQLSAIVYLTMYTTLWCVREFNRSRRRSQQLLVDASPAATDKSSSVSVVLKHIPWWNFVLIGLSDALGSLLGNVGAARIIGYQITLLVKLNIPFSAICSILILSRRFVKLQYFGMFLVICGGVAGLMPTILSSSSGHSSGSGGGSYFLFVVVYIISVGCTAISMILRERVFTMGKDRGLDLDIFAVLTLSNVFTLLFTFLLMPISAIPQLGLNVPLADLGNYLKRAVSCFAGGCVGSPLSPLVYMTISVLYNICVQEIIKLGGAVLLLISNTITFPISAFAFLLNWPLVPASPFSFWIVIALILEACGVTMYKTNSPVEGRMVKTAQSEVASAEEERRANSSEASPLLKPGYSAGYT